jgi:hypothetical protein
LRVGLTNPSKQGRIPARWWVQGRFAWPQRQEHALFVCLLAELR